MQGHYELIGERPTYFPPFVNERFGTPPYWACTFASLLNGANVGWRGEKPAIHEEVRALAKASGDPDRKGGSTSSHMIQAIRTRYGEHMRLRRLPPLRVADRLAHGWVMVAGVTYGDLPSKYRLDKGFMKGHRVLVVGWQNGHTWLVDPLADEGGRHTGRKIAWGDFEPAWWSGEQLWFREGMFLPQPRYGERTRLDAPKPWVARRDTRLDLLSPVRAGVVARRVALGERHEATFDAVVPELAPLPASKIVGRRIRIASGPFKGYLLDPATAGVDATVPEGIGDKPKEGGAPGKPKEAAGGDSSVTGSPDPLKAAFLKGRRFEYDRIRNEVQPSSFPGRP